MNNLPETIALLNKASEGLIKVDAKAEVVLDKANNILDKTDKILDEAHGIEKKADTVISLLRILIIILIVISVVAFLIYAFSKGWFLKKSMRGGNHGYAAVQMTEK
jgi:hypothetical protein